jgi:hypothetical protein
MTRCAPKVIVVSHRGNDSGFTTHHPALGVGRRQLVWYRARSIGARFHHAKFLLAHPPIAHGHT